MKHRAILLASFALASASARAQDPAAADVLFMREMIPHHRQALEMTALVEERTHRRDLRMLAGRIEVSQTDEIAWMERWLEHSGAPAPAEEHAHHAGHHELMPGMLTPQEMATLAAATGPAFDRLFLEGMIRHHEGALAMVERLLATPGAAQATEVYQIATDIDADQRADISRMRALLEAMTPPADR